MTGKRASIFRDSAGLDLSAFAPKTEADAKGRPLEAVKAVAETANFRSREAAAPRAESRAATKRPVRRYRTGRSVQFNAKASQETIDAFYAITEAQDWVLGYTLERAVAALKRELEKTS